MTVADPRGRSTGSVHGAVFVLLAVVFHHEEGGLWETTPPQASNQKVFLPSPEPQSHSGHPGGEEPTGLPPSHL